MQIGLSAVAARGAAGASSSSSSLPAAFSAALCRDRRRREKTEMRREEPLLLHRDARSCPRGERRRRELDGLFIVWRPPLGNTSFKRARFCAQIHRPRRPRPPPRPCWPRKHALIEPSIVEDCAHKCGESSKHKRVVLLGRSSRFLRAAAIVRYEAHPIEFAFVSP